MNFQANEFFGNEFLTFFLKKKIYTKVICIDFISEQWEVFKMQYILFFLMWAKAPMAFCLSYF